MQRYLGAVKTAAVIGSSRRQKTARGFPGASCVAAMQLERLPDVVGKAYEILWIHIFKTRVRDEAKADAIAKSEKRRPAAALSAANRATELERNSRREARPNSRIGTPPDCWFLRRPLQSVVSE